jgi:hypothetical protein
VDIFNANTSYFIILLQVSQVLAIGLCIIGSQLPKKKVKKYSLGFLLPLMKDFKQIFHKGFETYYNYPSHCIHLQSTPPQGGKATI